MKQALNFQILILAIIGCVLILANCSNIDAPYLPPPEQVISSPSFSSDGSDGSSSSTGSSSSAGSSSSGGSSSSSTGSSSGTSSSFQPTCGGEIFDTATHYCSNGTIKEYIFLIDERNDPKTYKTVEIGTQTWMAENLNYFPESGSKCYNNLPANCDNYGRLYNWVTAGTVCPSGWHLPSDEEWSILIIYVENNSVCSNCAGKHLKSLSVWSNTGKGMDTYGFSALPGGGSYSDTFSNIGTGGRWWSSSEVSDINAYRRIMNDDSDVVTQNSYDKGSGFFSVRCVKDDS